MSRPKIIIHLDDHQLFTDAMKKGVMDKYFPDCLYFPFNGDKETLAFIQEKLANEEVIDLVITDYNHPGLSGYKFAKAVKQSVNNHRASRIPIVCLTMAIDHPNVVLGKQKGIFDKCLSKNADALPIAAICNRLLQKRIQTKWEH